MMLVHRIAKNGFAICIMVVLLMASVACGNNSTLHTTSDKDYRHKLVGTWTERNIGAIATLERTLSFSADGTYHSSAKLAKQGNVFNYQNRGTWSIENGVIYITVIESTFADIPLGKKIPNKIITLNETEAITENADGVVTTAYRIQ